jgi:hypothetical protein
MLSHGSGGGKIAYSIVRSAKTTELGRFSSCCAPPYSKRGFHIRLSQIQCYSNDVGIAYMIHCFHLDEVDAVFYIINSGCAIKVVIMAQQRAVLF